jgi:hypothetical protein
MGHLYPFSIAVELTRSGYFPWYFPLFRNAASGAFDARDISSRILLRWKQHTNFRAGFAQLS